MNKKQELLRLDATIRDLGDDSYLGPWLKTVRHEVERDINSDIFPSILPSETAKQCEKIRKDAEEYAAGVKAYAEKKAASIIDEARERANNITKSAIYALRAGLRDLEN